MHVPQCSEEVLYITAQVALASNSVQLYLELRFAKGTPGARAFLKTEKPDFAPLAFDAISSLLS